MDDTMKILLEFFKKDKLEKVERYKRLNSLAKKGQIVFTGSSLMEQFPVNELLQNKDCKLNYAIYNRGIGGFTTSEMLEVIDVMVNDLEPEYVFINIGTNDLNGPDYKKEDLIERYRAILNNIKEHNPDAKIFVLAYYPMCKAVALKNEHMREVIKYRDTARVNEANEAVCALAKELKLEFLNLNSGITGENGDVKEEYSIEGMHMYATGYDKVLDELLPILQSL